MVFVPGEVPKLRVLPGTFSAELGKKPRALVSLHSQGLVARLGKLRMPPVQLG